PLGMTDTHFILDNARHARTYADIATTLHDFARVGQMMMNGGKWGNRQIVPQAWVRECLKPSLSSEYGFLWWLVPEEGGFAMQGYLNTSVYCFPKNGLEVVRMQNNLSATATQPYMPNALGIYRAI